MHRARVPELSQPELMRSAMENPISVVFIFEAVFLMFLIAWLLGLLGVRPLGRIGFIALSLLGSMAFSVPATVYWITRNGRPPHGNGSDPA